MRATHNLAPQVEHFEKRPLTGAGRRAPQKETWEICKVKPGEYGREI